MKTHIHTHTELASVQSSSRLHFSDFTHRPPFFFVISVIINRSRLQQYASGEPGRGASINFETKWKSDLYWGQRAWGYSSGSVRCYRGLFLRRIIVGWCLWTGMIHSMIIWRTASYVWDIGHNIAFEGYHLTGSQPTWLTCFYELPMGGHGVRPILPPFPSSVHNLLITESHRRANLYAYIITLSEVDHMGTF